MQSALGLNVSGVRLATSREQAQIDRLPACADLRSEFFPVRPNTKHPGGVVCTRPALVFRIQALICQPQVCDSVVTRIAIDMVDQPVRPLPILKTPNKAMQSNQPAPQLHAHIPFATFFEACSASPFGVAAFPCLSPINGPLPCVKPEYFPGGFW